MRPLLILISFVYLFCSCKDKNHAVVQAPVWDTTERPQVDTVAKQNEDDNKKIPIKFHLRFDLSKTLMKNLVEGWVDTFSIDNQHFRLLVDTTATNYEFCCIEQIKNGKWNKLFNLYLSSDEYMKDDINKDGHLDFVKFYHNRHYIYFYNPVIKSLSDTVCIMPEDYKVVDEGKFIMYNHYGAMYGNTYESSQLYIYKGIQPYFYYELLLIDNDSSDIKKINLYKFNNDNEDDTIFIKNIKMGKDIKFNYADYWKSNFMRLMGCR